MRQSILILRKSDFYPEPVPCCVIEIVDGNYVNAMRKRDEWIQKFTKQFPEFKNATFYQETIDLL